MAWAVPVLQFGSCWSRYNARMKNAVVAAVLVLAMAAGAQRPAPASARTGACAVPNQPVAITRCEPASIYVADFDRSAIERILNRHFDGFTILPARGCWHKLCENSVVIQIAGATEPQLRKAAEELRSAGKQESVLVVVPPPPR
jgi:hypothetical protein